LLFPFYCHSRAGGNPVDGALMTGSPPEFTPYLLRGGDDMRHKIKLTFFAPWNFS